MVSPFCSDVCDALVWRDPGPGWYRRTERSCREGGWHVRSREQWLWSFIQVRVHTNGPPLSGSKRTRPTGCPDWGGVMGSLAGLFQAGYIAWSSLAVLSGALSGQLPLPRAPASDHRVRLHPVKTRLKAWVRHCYDIERQCLPVERMLRPSGPDPRHRSTPGTPREYP
jgi:hypothetical protein